MTRNAMREEQGHDENRRGHPVVKEEGMKRAGKSSKKQDPKGRIAGRLGKVFVASSFLFLSFWISTFLARKRILVSTRPGVFSGFCVPMFIVPRREPTDCEAALLHLRPSIRPGSKRH